MVASMTAELTALEQLALQVIEHWVRELGRALARKKHTAQYLMAQLVKKGRIERKRGAARGYRVVA